MSTKIGFLAKIGKLFDKAIKMQEIKLPELPYDFTELPEAVQNSLLMIACANQPNKSNNSVVIYLSTLLFASGMIYLIWG